MREHILTEIRRLAEARGGQPPGKLVFTRQTGIGEHQWSGVLWARWSDALAEAGYKGNTLQGRFDTGDVLTKVVEACRHYGRVPTVAEMKLYSREDPGFPSKGAVASHFPTKTTLLSGLAQRASQNGAFRDIAAILQMNHRKARLTERQVRGQQRVLYICSSLVTTIRLVEATTLSAASKKSGWHCPKLLSWFTRSKRTTRPVSKHTGTDALPIDVGTESGSRSARLT